MMLCLANYILSIVISGCVKYPLKQIRIMLDIFFLLYVSWKVPLAASVLEASHGHVRACAGMCGRVQVCAKYTHVEVM